MYIDNVILCIVTAFLPSATVTEYDIITKNIITHLIL